MEILDITYIFEIYTKKRGFKMIIDFHTHVFPEVIAAKTIEKLSTFANITAKTNGVLSGLKASMQEAGVDYFPQIMCRDICGHTNSDTSRAIY